MSSEALHKLPAWEENGMMRITCSTCGKLLFKLAPEGPRGQEKHERHKIEIKCHNRNCKTINTIKI